jgi:integrase
MKVAWLSGLRIHECTRLTVGHLEDGVEKGEVEIVGKGGRVRTIDRSLPTAGLPLTAYGTSMPGRSSYVSLVSMGKAEPLLKHGSRWRSYGWRNCWDMGDPKLPICTLSRG